MAGRFIDLGAIDIAGGAIDLDVARGLLDLDDIRPGTRPGKPVMLKPAQAQSILNEVVRLVADLPRKSTPDVVWTLGADELLVQTDETTIATTSGIVTITVLVRCDEVDDEVEIPVPIGVGTKDAPAGLVMSAFDQLQGPTVITDVWTDAITAFAWECLVEVCRTVAANVGVDGRGRPLIPGLVSAGPKGLSVEAMARHDVRGRGSRR